MTRIHDELCEVVKISHKFDVSWPPKSHPCCHIWLLIPAVMSGFMMPFMQHCHVARLETFQQQRLPWNQHEQPLRQACTRRQQAVPQSQLRQPRGAAPCPSLCATLPVGSMLPWPQLACPSWRSSGAMKMLLLSYASFLVRFTSDAVLTHAMHKTERPQGPV